jgi:hypothetical protein
MKKLLILCLFCTSCAIFKYPEIPSYLVKTDVITNRSENNFLIEFGNVQRFMNVTIDVYDEYDNELFTILKGVVFSGTIIPCTLSSGKYNVYIYAGDRNELLLMQEIGVY